MTAPDRIVVVGAGIVGASLAFHLARRGAQVTVLDAGRPGAAATAVSFAWINARDKSPRSYHELNRRSLDMWDRFARRIGVPAAVRWGGELRWAATRKGARQLTQRVRRLQGWGYPIHLLDPSQLHRLEPDLVTGEVTAGSFSDADGHVDAVAVVDACLTRARSAGAAVRPATAVTGLSRDASGRIRAVAAAGDEVPCDVAVLAAGADTQEVAALAGVRLPMRNTFGATLVTRPVAPVLRTACVVHTPRDLAPPRVNFRQLTDGSVSIHGGDARGSLGRDDDEAAQVLEAAAGFVPALREATVSAVRRGRRPVPADGHPAIGFASAAPNLYLAAMHSGVTLAPLVGELAASEILDGARVQALRPFRPQRFDGLTVAAAAGARVS